jgi:SLT domain-containing protein
MRFKLIKTDTWIINNSKGGYKMRGLFKKVYEELNSKNNYGH